MVDLTGPGNTVGGGVQQAVSTVAGQLYQISFFVGSADNTYSGYAIPATGLELVTNGTSAGTFTNTASTPNGVNWKQFTASFTASSSLTTLSFLNATPAGGNLAGLDNVSIAIGSSMPDLTITKSHTGSFTQGQSGATYSITITNSGSAITSGTVSVTDTLPNGLTAATLGGNGWNCTFATVTCTRGARVGLLERVIR